MILGIDPGQSGAFVFRDNDSFVCRLMPLRHGDAKDIDFPEVRRLLDCVKSSMPSLHVFLERSVAFGMGPTGAFNYGRGFAALELAIELAKLPVTYVESAKWTKVMHEGTPAEWKPKARSMLAVQRLFPELISVIPKAPKSKKLHEGVIDALLIAEFGRRARAGA